MLKQELDKVLKKAISKFGVNLEGYIAAALKIYTGVNYTSIKESIRQDLGFLIRDCIDDRGWYFDRHSTEIEEFLLKNVSRVPTFPEPILFASQFNSNNRFFNDLDDIFKTQVKITEDIFKAYYCNDWVTPNGKPKPYVDIDQLPLNIKLKLL